MNEHAFALLILAVGIATVIGLILALKLNAFIALITSAIVVSVLANARLEFFVKPKSEQNASATAEKAEPVKIDWGMTIKRVAVETGAAAGNFAVVIALAAVIGECMMLSGAADRIVRAFVRMTGEDKAPAALMSSGFVLAVPVFFDTVFYLLVPLARSLYRRTNKNYLLYILAISAGGAVTHTLVPPTPGPLLMAGNLKVDIGWMILVGAMVGAPMSLVGLGFSWMLNRWNPIPMRQVGATPDPEPLKDEELPSLWASALPVALPVLLISGKTVVDSLSKASADQYGAAVEFSQLAVPWASVFGDPNFAMLLAMTVAIVVLCVNRKTSRLEIAKIIETSLMSAGVIILITAAGGAFGAMLKEADLKGAIEYYSRPDADALAAAKESAAGLSGLYFLMLGFGMAVLLKVAQGSSTVAMITASAMVGSMIEGPSTLGFHPVYICTAIGCGSLIGSWMNDSGFWIFAKMGGLTEEEALKSWSLLLIVMGLTGLAVTIGLTYAMPLAG